MPMPYLHQEITVSGLIDALKGLPQDYMVWISGVEPCIYVYDKRNYVLIESGSLCEAEDEESDVWE